MERKNKSPVWKVFIKDAAHKRTVCTLCGKEFKYRYTTTNLRDHLKRYHPEWLPECGMNSTPKQVASPATVASPRYQVVAVSDSSSNVYVDTSIHDENENARKNKSSVWQVFLKDADNKSVTCTLCHKDFKFWNNTTNLRAHIRRSHPEWSIESVEETVESAEEGDSDDYEVGAQSRRSSTSSSNSFTIQNSESGFKDEISSVWKVFIKDDSSRRMFCTLCQKEISYMSTMKNLREHVKNLHPEWQPVAENSPKGSDQEEEETYENVISKNSVFLVNSDRKNRSPVWEVFVRDNARKRTICMLCNKDFKCWNNTANLLDHLRRIHPNWKPKSSVFEHKVEDIISDRKRPTITRLRNSVSENDSKPVLTVTLANVSAESQQSSSHSLLSSTSILESKSKRIDRLIAEMICLDFQNLSIVEDIGFNKLMVELNPLYNMPSRKNIVKKTLPEMYDTVAKRMRSELEKCKYVSVSAELWTNQNIEAFLTLTVHYYSNERYCSSVLQTERIHTEHSSEDLAAVMHKVFDHWQIFEKITAIIADDDEALKAASNLLNITHLPCIASILNAIITEVLTENDEAQVLLQRCQTLVAHFKMNSSTCDILHDIQSQMGHPVLNLKQVAPTRWNSALHMFQRLVEIKEPLTTTLVAMPEGPEPLASIDWLNLEDFIALLKPFELMASELATDSYCKISKVIPLIRGVQSSLQNTKCATDLGAALRKTILQKLESRFCTYEKYVIPSVATLLDPRFKRAGLGVDNAIETTTNFVVDQLSELKKRSTDSSGEKPAVDGEITAESKSDIWNFLDEKVNEISSQKVPNNTAEVSVKQYLDLPYLKRQDCPFKFWINQSYIEPELADIAMKFMCIPATSFPAERLYSKGGVLISERRNRITSKHFDTIIFLNKNL